MERSNRDANQLETIACEDIRTTLTPEGLARAFLDNLYCVLGRFPAIATKNDLYMALAYTVRDRMLHRWISTVRSLSQDWVKKDFKGVAYLSAEFLTGPLLACNLVNLGIYDQVREAMRSLGYDLDELIDVEEEPGLGNGGLGRLAACYMDSLATVEVPAIGYGIRYEFGIFDQEIKDGWQVEITDKWLRFGNPWEIARPELAIEVKLGGRTEHYTDEHGRHRVRWIPGRLIKGVPYDTPIPGYKVTTCNTMRLWKAEAVESFDFQDFNVGDYYGAVEEKVASETISKVLYPNDEPEVGKALRLRQQYFFVSCSLRDLLRMITKGGGTPHDLPRHFAIQLNDTHPSIAVAELMRMLLDRHEMDWDEAWGITLATFGFTNHTLLPEALEKWPVELFEKMLPRHLEIIYEVNRRFLDEVRTRFPGDEERIARLSLIDETGGRYVRMAHLASVGSHCINGVAELHSRLLKETVLKDLYEMYPERFTNVTNGVTPRRWMVVSNPGLSGLITSRIGDAWVTRTEDELQRLEPLADDEGFRAEWRRIQRDNKVQLAALIREAVGETIDPDSMFDVQVKRLHEYKRQHLSVFHIVALYNRIKRNPGIDVCPRTFIFGGKAAPGYRMAKLIIKLINAVGEVVNKDPDVAGRLKVIFVPNFNVKVGHRVYPAADLSEQISTAGKEASGTGNMKFSMNGALTIGTLDGANVEIRDAVGAENFFLFGLTAEEVLALKASGYQPGAYYEANQELREVVDLIASGFFSRGDRELFRLLIDSLMERDDYMLFADYQSYVDRQTEVGSAFLDEAAWTRRSILNAARVGRFSSDRSIREYCTKIWEARPFEVALV